VSQNEGQSSALQVRFSISDLLLLFRNRACRRRLGSKIDAKFLTIS